MTAGPALEWAASHRRAGPQRAPLSARAAAAAAAAHCPDPGLTFQLRDAGGRRGGGVQETPLGGGHQSRRAPPRGGATHRHHADAFTDCQKREHSYKIKDPMEWKHNTPLFMCNDIQFGFIYKDKHIKSLV